MDKKTTFKYASERERVRRTNKALFLGFAVVADQIRELAEKTKGETENIERVMDELSENAQLAANAVASSVDATNKEDQEIMEQAAIPG